MSLLLLHFPELTDIYIRRSRSNRFWWKGGTWSELNRTKVYSISKKLSSAKVGNPLYLNSSHVVRAKPLHSSLHQKRSPSLKKNPFLCQFHFVFLNDLTINVLLFHPRVVCRVGNRPGRVGHKALADPIPIFSGSKQPMPDPVPTLVGIMSSSTRSPTHLGEVLAEADRDLDRVAEFNPRYLT